MSCVKLSGRYKKHFEEIRLLGNGGFSTVFEAKFKLNGESYAIKKIPFNIDAELKSSKEINMLKSLKSEYVVSYIDSWIEENYYLEDKSDYGKNTPSLLYNPYRNLLLHIQMELCPMTLEMFIQQMKLPNKNEITLEKYGIVCQLFIQLTVCIQYLHLQTPPIIHRDLKPANVMLIESEKCLKVKLTDFGLSTYHDFVDQKHSINIGTRTYRAPEVEDGVYNTKSDIYSLGKIMEEMFNFDLNNDKNNNDLEINEFYENAKYVCVKCCSARHIQRPTCDDILDKQNSWLYSFCENIILHNKTNGEKNGASTKLFCLKWPKLNLLREDFMSKCKIMAVVEEIEEKVIFITQNMNLYVIRVSEHIDSTFQKPKMIKELKGKEIQKIVCGATHVLCLTTNHEVFTFGTNKNGQLGYPSDEINNKPENIKNLNDKCIIDIKCGAEFSVALTESGKIFSWGAGYYGQIGNGSYKNQHSPAETNNLDQNKIASISCGSNHCLALSMNGVLYGWGNNEFGQLGIGNNINQYKPTVVKTEDKVDFKKITCGKNHSLVLTHDFCIYSFGCNTFGQLGLGHNKDKNQMTKVCTTIKFIDVETLISEDISIALSSNKEFYLWGKGCDKKYLNPHKTKFKSFYETFLNSTKNNSFFQNSFKINGNIRDFNLFLRFQSNSFKENYKKMIVPLSLCVIKVKERKAILITNDDLVYTYRLNESIDKTSDSPLHVNDLSNKSIKNIICGYNHTLCLTTSMDVFAFGDNIFGVLGNRTNDRTYKPEKILELTGKQIKEISCGYYHCLALSENGQVYAWGDGSYGQIGNNFNICQPSPIEVKFPGSKKIISISCGGSHCLALSKDGDLFGWGNNECNQIGIENKPNLTSNRNKPELITNKNNIVILKISCGLNHSLILSENFEIFSFGSNAFGKLGIGNQIINQSIMTKIEVPIKFCAIYTTFCDHLSAASTESGTYYVWGKCADDIITTPKEIYVNSFEEIFSKYSLHHFTAKQINLY